MRVWLEDGPAPWGGQTVETAGVGDTLERTLTGTVDEYVLGVWKDSGATVKVEVVKKGRNATRVLLVPARVYRFHGERRVLKHPVRRTSEPEQMQLAA